MRCGDGEVDAENSSHSSYSTVDCPIRKDSSLSCIPIDDQKRWLINYYRDDSGQAYSTGKLHPQAHSAIEGGVT
jgi:hypothetical protein